MKCYELHYLPKKVDSGDKLQQFGCIHFHSRRDIGAKLTPAIKNKWPAGWTKAWFYCNVPRQWCEPGGKAVNILPSHMSGLEFKMEPPFNYDGSDSGDVAFVWATKFL
jgi:hypothetical protein